MESKSRISLIKYSIWYILLLLLFRYEAKEFPIAILSSLLLLLGLWLGETIIGWIAEKINKKFFEKEV